MVTRELDADPGARRRAGANAYAIALERERCAWIALLQVKRDDPQYTLALAEWRAAVDAITVAAQKLVKLPKL